MLTLIAARVPTGRYFTESVLQVCAVPSASGDTEKNPGEKISIRFKLRLANLAII